MFQAFHSERPPQPRTTGTRVTRDTTAEQVTVGLVGCIFAVSGPTAIMLAVGNQAGMTHGELASWLFGAFFINGLISLVMCWIYRQPVVFLWSIPGIVLVGPALEHMSFAEVLGGYYAAGAASDEEGGVRDPGARRRRRREEEDEESPPAQLQDIKSILLRRQQLAKWHNQPFFEDAVVGAFVRVSLGNNSEGQLVYRLARIREVRDRSAEVGKSYAFGGRDNRSHETTKYLLLEQGASERVFPMRECSNAVDEIPEDEERWLFKLLEQSDSVPTRRDCEAVARQLQQANDFRYGSQHVKLMVEERRQKGLVHEGTTREKVRLNVERQAAIKAGDAERVAELAAKIEALERRVEQERLSDQRAQRVSMASINERNKKWTVAQDQAGGKARREAGGGDGAQDNFSRYKTRPQKYFQMRKATGAGEGGGEGGAQGGGEGGAQGASADAGEDKDDQEAMEETADLLASHVPNLHVDLGRVQAAARRLLGGGGGVGAGSGGGGLPWLGHTLKHLPPQSNLVEPPDKVYQITLEEYHRRVEG